MSRIYCHHFCPIHLDCPECEAERTGFKSEDSMREYELEAKIDRLRADNERLRDAVIGCLSWMQCYCGNPYCGKCRAIRKADAALAAGEE